MKRIFTVTTFIIFGLQLTTNACASLLGSERYNKEMAVIRELTQDPKSRKWKGNENDVNDLMGCGFQFEGGGWKKSKYGVGAGARYIWDRDISSFDGKMISSGGDSIDFNPAKFGSSVILANPIYHSVYIGPWKLVTLTHKSGFFPFYQTESETKLIRFFAYTGIGSGSIQYQFESQTFDNKNIPEKEFSLPPNTKIPPDRFSLCVVKWTAKYGYNAIAEVKSKNSWSKDYLIPTGRIIDSETGDIIVDESDKFTKTQ